MKYVVFMCWTIKILIAKLTSDAKIQPAVTARQGRQLLLTFLTMVTRWSAPQKYVFEGAIQYFAGQRHRLL